jgi:hypothetical protein
MKKPARAPSVSDESDDVEVVALKQIRRLS